MLRTPAPTPHNLPGPPSPEFFDAEALGVAAAATAGTALIIFTVSTIAKAGPFLLVLAL
ncbi:MAG: hypothetical protein JST92_17815 [Deltaproteobacteria bacterium]|nr:hypothetical protein [Deltaproteobacteria bacterium]